MLRIGGPGRIEVHEPEPEGVLHNTKRTAADPWVDVLAEGTTELPGLRAVVTRADDGLVLDVTPTA